MFTSTSVHFPCPHLPHPFPSPQYLLVCPRCHRWTSGRVAIIKVCWPAGTFLSSVGRFGVVANSSSRFPSSAAGLRTGAPGCPGTPATVNCQAIITCHCITDNYTPNSSFPFSPSIQILFTYLIKGISQCNNRKSEIHKCTQDNVFLLQKAKVDFQIIFSIYIHKKWNIKTMGFFLKPKLFFNIYVHSYLCRLVCCNLGTKNWPRRKMLPHTVEWGLCRFVDEIGFHPRRLRSRCHTLPKGTMLHQLQSNKE